MNLILIGRSFNILRVIAGSARGMRLKTLKGETTRPTRDIVKEALFNVISEDIKGKNILDMFSGSGSLGIEALSRGANKALFIDLRRESCNIVKQNLTHTRFLDKAVVRCMNALNKNALSNVLKHDIETKLNLVFLDPPYDKGMVGSALSILLEVSALSDDVLIVAEHKSDEDIPCTVGKLSCVGRKKYGITSVSFYKFREDMMVDI